MNPLQVFYEHRVTMTLGKTLEKPRRLVISRLSAELFDIWKQMIEKDIVDEVLIIGQHAAIGWRIYVDRPVRFMEEPTVDEVHANFQRSAMQRILQKDHLSADTISPYNLIQEWVDRDIYYPWRVLVTCVLLNKTHGRQVRPIFMKLFELCKTPETTIEIPVEQIVEILRPLGLQNVRAKRLRELSADYLQRRPMREMRGVGQYAIDAYAVFCNGRTDIEPEDTWLKPYVEWRKAGGQRVNWPITDFEEWWHAGST